MALLGGGDLQNIFPAPSSKKIKKAQKAFFLNHKTNFRRYISDEKIDKESRMDYPIMPFDDTGYAVGCFSTLTRTEPVPR
jgi:hypothetical protein